MSLFKIMKNFTVSGIIIFLITLSILPMVTETVSGKLITRFDNEGGIPEVLYDLQWDEAEDVGMEAKGYFSIPSHRGKIKNASVKIKCMPDTMGNYLTDPRLDIGLDGDYEWMFSGKGYGSAGNQNLFSSGMNKRRVTTTRQGAQNFDNRSYILLPTTAEVSSAYMNIKGGPGQFEQDVMVGTNSNGYVYYFISKGDGTFYSPKLYGDVTNGYTYSIGLGDFDDDNDQDIVFGSKVWSQNFAEFYLIENNNYDGGSANHPWGDSPGLNKLMIGRINVTGWNYVYDIVVEDFDNDGNLDFITNLRGGTYYLFRGRPDLTFFDPETLSVSYPGSYALGKDAADFNNDGNMDFVAGGTTSGTVYYYEGKGDGSFKSAQNVDAGSGNYQYSLATADFNDDFNPDIITKNRRSGTGPFTMDLVKGNGDGTFKEPEAVTDISFSSWWDYGLADNYDFNYDGYQDLAVQHSTTFYYYAGEGNGEFKTGSSIGSASSLYSVATPPRLPLGRCENLSVDIGDDQSTEKQYSGLFNSEETLDFTNTLKTLITNPNTLEVIIDDYGNEMYKIPIRFDSSSVGSVLLHNLDIRYNYTATVHDLPGVRVNLADDLNDLLPLNENISDILRVQFGLYSDTPGKVRLSDLNIEYNGAPECSGIGLKVPIAVNEDTDTKVIDLTDGYFDNGETIYYFTDDYDERSKLVFGIYSNSDPEHVELSVTNDKWLRVNSTQVPNWYGSIDVQLWCMDTEGIRSVSNEFELFINPVNDPPMAHIRIPNIELLENQTKIPIYLDEPNIEYFIDVDSEKLYYRAALAYPEKHGEQLAVEVISETNGLRMSSIGSFGKNIEVRVYCDDTAELLDLSLSELELVETYQTIYVNITSSTSTFPPQWLDLSLFPMQEDKPWKDMVNLRDHVTDEDDSIENLSFSIHSLSHSGYIDVIIEENGYLSLFPHHNFDGTASMTLIVTDDEQNSDLTTVIIEIIGTNDQPIVKISEPQNGSTVSGIVDIIGSAYDPENDLEMVEICIGEGGTWESVNGLGYWTYRLDTAQFKSNQREVLVKVRAEDGTGSQSLMDKAYLRLAEAIQDTDNDGVEDIKDKFPFDPTEWVDSDNDGFGDNEDGFPKDDTQWADTDGDGYGDYLYGNRPDEFPHDPTQWNDTDGDGFGDNLWGNDGDYYPHDKTRSQKEYDDSAGVDDEVSSRVYSYLFALIGLIVVILVTVIIFINYLIKYFKHKKKS